MVDDDPKRPYKAYVAVVAAMLTSILATNATDLGPVGVGIVSAILAGVTVYITPNPKV